MRNGHIFMGPFNAEQVMYNHFGYRTPIANLYLAGSSGHPGGAISGGVGYSRQASSRAIWASSCGGSRGTRGRRYSDIAWIVVPSTIGGLFPTGLTVFANAPCYCRGTLIEVARGQKNVETLSIGDKVRTASGALRPIKWIGRRSYAGRFVMGRKDILPVCVRAGALGENLPERDLWISPNHAMYFSVASVGWVERSETHHTMNDGFRKGSTHPTGVLIEAKDLVNGVSIVQAAHVEKVEYFHIELDTHDVIIAEGALAESFVDDDSRAMFHNAHDYATLYADEVRQPACYCAPRLNEGYEVEAVRQRLAQRAGLVRSADAPRLGTLRGYIDRIRTTGIAGWAQNINAPEAPVCLDVFADGKLIGRVLANTYREDLEQAGLGSGRHGFEFTPPAGLKFAPDTIEVRRSLDSAPLNRAAPRAPAQPSRPANIAAA